MKTWNKIPGKLNYAIGNLGQLKILNIDIKLTLIGMRGSVLDQILLAEFVIEKISKLFGDENWHHSG